MDLLFFILIGLTYDFSVEKKSRLLPWRYCCPYRGLITFTLAYGCACGHLTSCDSCGQNNSMIIFGLKITIKFLQTGDI
jgi:hypothetical protein